MCSDCLYVHTQINPPSGNIVMCPNLAACAASTKDFMLAGFTNSRVRTVIGVALDGHPIFGKRPCKHGCSDPRVH
jgi:hypothetical protein